MAVYLPVRSLNRSSAIRIGTQTATTGTTIYVDISNASVRRDLAHHTSIGQVLVVGGLSQSNVDTVVTTGGTVTAGAGLTVNVAAGETRTRSTGAYVAGAAATNQALAAAPSAGNERTDLVSWSSSGAVVVTNGTVAATGASVVPATPTGNTPLATVLVPASATVPGTITDVRPRS